MKKLSLIFGTLLLLMDNIAFVQGQEQGLPRLAVVEFAVNTDIPKVRQDTVAIRNAVQSNFVATGKYEVIARTEIDQLVQNQQIALSAISSQENIQKLQLANINYIVTGTVDAMGDDYSVTINILDVGNGRFAHSAMDLIGSGSRDIFNGINTLVKNFIQGMSSSGRQIIQQTSYKIGDRGPAGGWVFYDKGAYSSGWRYLEAAPVETEFRAEWGVFDLYEDEPMGTAWTIGAGKRNTQIIVEYLWEIGESGKAAQLCDSFSVDGYDDWFLPSRDELNLMYQNLKQEGLGEFSDDLDLYWSSSEHGFLMEAWFQSFSNGHQGTSPKRAAHSVRAVRAF
jgi:hypothetical protein